jgi:hypothetical protein
MANYNQLQRLTFDIMRSLDHTLINGGFTAIGTDLTHPANQFMVSNFTNVPLVFSTDGSNDHFVLAAGAQWINDDKANNIFFPVGSTIWVSELTGAATSGAVYFSVIYGGH